MDVLEARNITNGHDTRIYSKKVIRFTSRWWNKRSYRMNSSETALADEIRRASKKGRDYIFLEDPGWPSAMCEMRKRNALRVFAPRGFKLVVKTLTYEGSQGSVPRNIYLVCLAW